MGLRSTLGDHLEDGKCRVKLEYGNNGNMGEFYKDETLCFRRALSCHSMIPIVSAAVVARKIFKLAKDAMKMENKKRLSDENMAEISMLLVDKVSGGGSSVPKENAPPRKKLKTPKNMATI